MNTYRKKPVEVEALKIDSDSRATLAIKWMSDNLYPMLVGDATNPETLKYPDQLASDNSKPDKGCYIDPSNGALMIRTLEGDMIVGEDDYLIRGVSGEFYPCKPDIFERTYDEVAYEG